MNGYYAMCRTIDIQVLNEIVKVVKNTPLPHAKIVSGTGTMNRSEKEKRNSCIKIMYHDSLDDLKWSFIITLAFNYHGKLLRSTLSKVHKCQNNETCNYYL